jgi:hypothetical protein
MKGWGGKYRRRPRRAGLTAVVVCLLALAIGTSSASADVLPAPNGFRLQGSNGYSIDIAAVQSPKSGRGALFVYVHRKGSAVFYAAPASVAATSFQADLGSVGHVDVHFVPSGEVTTANTECDSGPVSFDSGQYEGTIDFDGEEGYSEAHVISARGDVRFLTEIVCGGDVSTEGSGGHSPGARLTVRHRGNRKFEFTAMKNSPSRPARFTASLQERRGTLLISREVQATASPAAFAFDVPAGVAAVDPPAPFAGEAAYKRTQRATTRWRGNLTVDFPGRSGVRLTGVGTRAAMIRAVLNPSHPF